MVPLYRWILQRPGIMIPVFFLSITGIVKSQYLADDASSAALGGCFSTMKGIAAVSGNQAGLGWKKPAGISTTCTSPFIVTGLASASLSATIPLYHGNIAGRITSFGMRGYLENSLWISYGLRISEKISSGAAILYHALSAGGKIFHTFQVGCGLGVQVIPDDKIMIAGHIFHPFGLSSPDKLLSLLPSSITIGSCYEFISGNILCLELTLFHGDQLVVSGGLESQLNESFRLRAGYCSNPASLTMGTGFHYHKLWISISARIIFHLGTTPSITISYEI